MNCTSCCQCGTPAAAWPADVALGGGVTCSALYCAASWLLGVKKALQLPIRIGKVRSPGGARLDGGQELAHLLEHLEAEVEERARLVRLLALQHSA